MRKLWNANKNKVNFWISLVTFVLILGLTYIKFKFGLSFTTADLTLITSTLFIYHFYWQRFEQQNFSGGRSKH